MSIDALIEQLKQLDIKLSLDRDELSIDAPKGVLTKDLVYITQYNSIFVQ